MRRPQNGFDDSPHVRDNVPASEMHIAANVRVQDLARRMLISNHEEIYRKYKCVESLVVSQNSDRY